MVDDFFKDLSAKNLSSKTIRFYTIDINQFQKFINKDIKETSTENLQLFISFLTENDFKTQSIIRKVCTIITLLRWAKSKELITQEISFKSLNFPENITEQKKELSNEQILNLINTIEKSKSKRKLRDSVLYKLLIFRGLKTQEVQNIKIENVNLVDNVIKIIRTPKRKTYVNPFYIDIGFIKEDVRLLINSRVSGLLFVNKYNQKLSIRSIRRDLAYYAKLAGIKINPSTLRYSFAQKRSLTDDFKILSQRLGHNSLQSTKKMLKYV